MTSRNGLSVDLRTTSSGKLWTFVTTRADGSPIAFEDWYHMIRGIIHCELVKYGKDPQDPAEWERWGQLARDFLARCFEFDVTFEDLRDEFGLPGSPQLQVFASKASEEVA